MAERMTTAELTAQTAEDVRVLREALAVDQGTVTGRTGLIAAAHPARIARLLDAVERERASRQAAQAQLEQTQEERNRARLQGERDARRVLKDEMEQLQRERDEARSQAAHWEAFGLHAEREREAWKAEAQRLRTALEHVNGAIMDIGCERLSIAAGVRAALGVSGATG